MTQRQQLEDRPVAEPRADHLRGLSDQLPIAPTTPSADVGPAPAPRIVTRVLLGVPSLWRRTILIAWDSLAWLMALMVFAGIRYDFVLTTTQWTWALLYTAAAIILQGVLGLVTHVYLGRSRVGSFSEASWVGALVLLTAIPLGLVLSLVAPGFPRGVALIAPPLALTLMAASRWALRLMLSPRKGKGASTEAVPAVVYGAGEAGHQVATLVDRAEVPPYSIVGFVDDDPGKRWLRVLGYRVHGLGKDIVDVARQRGAQVVILAISDPTTQLIQDLADRCTEHGLELVVIPAVRDMIGGHITLAELPVSGRIHLSSPDVGVPEEEAIVRAVRSGWIAPLGPEVDAFETELAAYGGREHAVALSSGTAALHLGLLTLGVGPGDVVLTSSVTFAATANAITYTGADPVFIDCDETGNMDPELLRSAFEALDREGRRVSAVVPVDLLGKVAAHERIAEIAAPRGVPVLSDAAESLGATRNGNPSASFGLAAAVSFNGNKIMTTSGGGALLTDDEEFAARVRYLATQARQPVVHYEHTDIGFNYRLSNILAALGRAQLARLDEMIERRRLHRIHYRSLFAGVPGVEIFGEPSGADGGESRDNFWLTSILIDPAEAGFSAEELRLSLASTNIEARPLWKPMHLQPVFASARSFVNGTGERMFRGGLSLPSGSVLTGHDVGRVDAAISAFLEGGRGR